MSKNNIYVLIFILLVSCDLVPSVKEDNDKPVARVFDKVLYNSELETFLPKNVSSSDSIVFAKNYINNWAKKQLLLHQAEINLHNQVNSFEKLVEDYRSTLYINSYKEALVSNKLDTVISQEEIQNYYNDNSQNFRLNEELVKFSYIYTENDREDKERLVKLFRSGNKEAIQELKSKELHFKYSNFNDSIWVKYNDVIFNSVVLRNINKNRFLRKGHFIEQNDSLGLCMVKVRDVLNKSDIAPLEYVEPTIKQVILQKRKLSLLRKIEVDLLDDALKNKEFEKY